MSQEQARGAEKGPTRAVAGKYLSFALSGERYGVEILRVQEIIGVGHITLVPRSPDYLRGVINLRGKIIPIVDLRQKFGMEPAEYNAQTCVIVLDVQLNERPMCLGMVVDTVLEVAAFSETTIEHAPVYGTTLETSFITGMGRGADGSVTILLDINRALSDAMPV